MWIRLAVACLLALHFSGCAELAGMLKTSDRPTVRVEDVRLEDLSLDGITLDLDAEITNPYGVPLPLAAAEYALASRGSAFLSGRAEQEMVIPASGKAIYPFSVRIGFAEIVRLVSGVRPGQMVPWSLDLTLFADAPAVGRISLPISTSGDLPVPAVPEVSLASFALENMSLDRVEAILSLSVSNPNPFGLDLADLGFRLALGGRQVGQAEMERPGTVSAGGEQVFRIPIAFSPARLGTAALSAFSRDRIDYSLDGGLRAGTPYGALNLPIRAGGDARVER